MRHLLLIFMAAGNANRFGANKLETDIDGKPMYKYVLDHLFAYKDQHEAACDVIVVSQYENILADARKRGGIVIRNDRPDEGISRTIRLSLEGKPGGDEEAAIFFTADQPYLTYATVEAFLDRAVSEEKGILSARSEVGMGNPVSFDQKYYAELRTLNQDQGGRYVALAHEDDTAWFETGRVEMKDIDRPGDVTPKA